MPEPNRLTKSIKDILPFIRKKILKPTIYPCEKNLRPFAKSFLKSLNEGIIQPNSIVKNLFETSLSFNATHIYLEPVDKYHQLLFRIDNKLRRVILLQKQEGEKLYKLLKDQSQKLITGEYNVIEGVIDLQTDSFKKRFSLFFIPRDKTNSVTITRIKSRTSHFQPHKNSPEINRPNIQKKIFVWQMGKVGSLSIYNSLKKHSTPTNWNQFILGQKDRWPTHNNLIQTHSIELLYNALHYSNEEFVIISLVRDLLSRNISSIFQSMNFQEEWRNEYFIAKQKEFRNFPYKNQEIEITRQLKKLNLSNTTLDWYDDLLRTHFYYPEISKYFIDVYAKPFDQEKGYQVYQSKTPRIQMIIIRIEELDNLESEIGSFLGIDSFRLIKTNIANTKWYQPIYRKFKTRYRPTEQELGKIYSSKFMTYFYPKSQIDGFIKKWQNS